MRKLAIVSLVVFMVVGMFNVVSVRKTYADEVDDLIEQLLHSEYNTTRKFIISKLEDIKNRRIVDVLIEALINENKDIRGRAAEALGEIKDPRAVEPLIEALKDYNNSVREEAAEALGKIGNERAVKPLVWSLRHRVSHSVQTAAAEALGKISDEYAVEFLIEVLSDTIHTDVIGATAWALGKIGDPRALNALIKAMSRGWISAPRRGISYHKEAKMKVAYALGKLGDSSATNVLLESLLDDVWSFGEEEVIAEALGKVADSEAVDTLIEMSSDEDPRIRRKAVIALGETGDSKVTEFILQALSDKRDYVREEAAEALGKIKDPRAVEPLIEALKDYNINVREEAAEALGKIGDERALDALRRFVEKSSNYRSRIIAKTAIIKIKYSSEEPREVVEELTTNEFIQQLSNGDKYEVIEAAEKLAEEKVISAAEPMLELLGSQDNEIRSAVTDSLESILPEIEEQQLSKVVSGVLELEKAETTAEKIEKVNQLKELGDIRALPALVRTLEKDGSSLRLATLDAIVSFGEEALNVLDIYKDDTKVGNYVTTAIDMIEEDIKIAEERKKQEAVTQLSSDDKKEVLSAISTIKKEKITEATEPLLKLLGDVDKDIQDATTGALSAIQPNIESEILSNIVDNVLTLTDTTLDTQERIDAALTLGEIGDPRAVDGMARTLADDDLDVVLADIKGLIKIGDAAIEPLTKYMDDPEIGNDVEYVLGEIEEDEGSKTAQMGATSNASFVGTTKDSSTVNTNSNIPFTSPEFNFNNNGFGKIF